MVKLCCAVVGEETVVTVDIEEQQLVGDLKERIKRKEGYGFPSSRLTLYLAKENGDANGEWMTDDDVDLAQLQAAMVPANVTLTHLRNELLMRPTRGLHNYFDRDTPQEAAIHVLVKLPTTDRLRSMYPLRDLPFSAVKWRGQRIMVSSNASFVGSSSWWPFSYLSQLLPKTASESKKKL